MKKRLKPSEIIAEIAGKNMLQSTASEDYKFLEDWEKDLSTARNWISAILEYLDAKDSSDSAFNPNPRRKPPRGKK